MAHWSRPARIDWVIRVQESHLTASISNGPSGAFSFLQYVRVWPSSVRPVFHGKVAARIMVLCRI